MDLYVTDQSPNCSRTMPSFYRSFLAMFLNVQSMEGEIVHWNVRFYFWKTDHQTKRLESLSQQRGIIMTHATCPACRCGDADPQDG